MGLDWIGGFGLVWVMVDRLLGVDLGVVRCTVGVDGRGDGGSVLKHY